LNVAFAFADPPSQRAHRVSPLVESNLKCPSLFEGREILALQIFGQPDLSQLLIAMLGDITWNHGQASQLCRPKTALAIHELVPFGFGGVGSHADAAGKAVLAYHLRKILEVSKPLAHLVWTRLDRIDGQIHGYARALRQGSREDRREIISRPSRRRPCNGELSSAIPSHG
jgi:hypothetical protein